MDSRNLIFDYVVIGSGPAGCACARALLESTEAASTGPVEDKGGIRTCTVVVLEEAGISEVVTAANSEPEVPACRTAEGASWFVFHWSHCYLLTFSKWCREYVQPRLCSASLAYSR